MLKSLTLSWCIGILLTISACADTRHHAPPPLSSHHAPEHAPSVKKLIVEQLPTTIRTEWEDRVNRIERLAKEFNISVMPEIVHFQIEPDTLKGQAYPVPVTMIRFTGKTFFAFNTDTPMHSSYEFINLMAEVMKRDMPDTHLLLLGHTDSIGSQEYNMNLSERRALNVLRQLQALGVRPSVMSTVAIGEMQPVESNKTEKGRATNRRVEFLISANQAANVFTVSRAEFCHSCINDHEPQGPAGRTGIKDLNIISLCDEPTQTVHSFLEEHIKVDDY